MKPKGRSDLCRGPGGRVLSGGGAFLGSVAVGEGCAVAVTLGARPAIRASSLLTQLQGESFLVPQVRAPRPVVVVRCGRDHRNIREALSLRL